MSADGSAYGRVLAEGEPAEPTSAVIATEDGRRVVCTLTRRDARTWTARPPAVHVLAPGDRFLIDRLPPGGAVEFEDVRAPVDSD